MISGMMGQTTVMVNGLNTGRLNAPRAASPKAAASASNLQKLFDTGKYDQALAAADDLIAKDPKSAEAHVWKGRAMGTLARENPANLMRYGPGALQEFEKALALEPDNPNAHLGRGIGRLSAPPEFGGDVDGAIADFQAAIARKPSAEAYYQLGVAFDRKTLHDQAAAAYKKAQELDPHHADAAKALAGTK